MSEINDVIRKFRLEVEKLYGKGLKDIILYGSWARDEVGQGVIL